MSLPVVALVGRPNVGKSTIFNRIINSRVAIVEDKAGVTRDRIYARAEWMGHEFILIDTGGITLDSGEIEEQIKAQAEIAIDEADVIVMLGDVTQHMTNMDETIAKMLYQTKKPVILTINKADNPEQRTDIYDFYSLGLGDPIPVSGSHGTGMGDLLDAIVGEFGDKANQHEDGSIRFSVIGRPNVGKSSLVNAILGEQRVIVSNIEGTTRDAIDTTFTNDGQKYTIVDTAGIRRRGKVYEKTEKYSVLRAISAIEESDITLLVLDASTGITTHDKHIAGYALEAGKAVILVVNKWDTIEDKDSAMKSFNKELKSEFQFMTYAPIVFLSALTKKRIHTLMPEIKRVYENSKREIKTNLLNDVINDAYALNLPPSYKGKRLKIYFSHQASVCPPTFNIQVNNKGLVHFSYERYLENKIRESFDFEGTPIVIQFKNKGEQEI